MPRFAYQALSQEGETISGELLAENDVLALDQLARRGLIPVSLKEGGIAERWWQRDITLFRSADQLPNAELERIFSTLSALLRARLPLPRALAFCEQQSRNRHSRRALLTARLAVENGATLAHALRDAGAAFPARHIALIASGEASNRLEAVASRTATALMAEAKIGRELRGALVYPVILMVMATLVMAMIMFFLAPTLLPVFASAGTPAPLALRFLAGCGTFIKANWLAMLVAGLGLCLALQTLRKPLFAWLSSTAMRLPIVGSHMRRAETLRMCHAMSLMLNSGASVLPALAAAKEAVHHTAFSALLLQAEIALTAGATLSSVLAPSGLIDPMALALITAGEEADRLPETLETASDALEAQISASVTQAVRLLTPILTLAIGGGVAAIILTTISAMMDLNDIAF